MQVQTDDRSVPNVRMAAEVPPPPPSKGLVHTHVLSGIGQQRAHLRSVQTVDKSKPRVQGTVHLASPKRDVHNGLQQAIEVRKPAPPRRNTRAPYCSGSNTITVAAQPAERRQCHAITMSCRPGRRAKKSYDHFFVSVVQAKAALKVQETLDAVHDVINTLRRLGQDDAPLNIGLSRTRSADRSSPKIDMVRLSSSLIITSRCSRLLQTGDH